MRLSQRTRERRRGGDDDHQVGDGHDDCCDQERALADVEGAHVAGADLGQLTRPDEGEWRRRPPLCGGTKHGRLDEFAATKHVCGHVRRRRGRGLEEQPGEAAAPICTSSSAPLTAATVNMTAPFAYVDEICRRLPGAPKSVGTGTPRAAKDCAPNVTCSPASSMSRPSTMFRNALPTSHSLPPVGPPSVSALGQVPRLAFSSTDTFRWVPSPVQDRGGAVHPSVDPETAGVPGGS